MNYYKISIKRRYQTPEQVIGHANGEFVPNARYYFDRIGNGEIIVDAPVFDYFHLESYGPKEEWEWKLQDVHGGIGEYPSGGYWYISDKCKQVFEKFNIANSYFFYATKLLYKGEKVDYWIFQFPINLFQNYNYLKSEYYVDGENNRIDHIHNHKEYNDFSFKLYNESKKSIIWKKLVLIDFFDIVMTMDSKVVSEKLKLAIEDANLVGFEFSEVEYEIVAEDEIL